MRKRGILGLIATVTIMCVAACSPSDPASAPAGQEEVDVRSPAAPAGVLAHAEKKSAQVRRPVVEYDPNTDALTVRAHDVALESLLQSVAAVTGIEIVFVVRRGLDRPVSVDLSGVPFEEALARLLRGFGKIIVRSGRNAPNGQPRLRVLVAGERSDGAASAELAERPGEGRAERARRIAAAVASVETPAERADAIDGLVSLLDESDQRNYDLAVRILREFDPERAIDELERRLDEDAEVDEDARDVSERRAVAAAGLGTVLAATPPGESLPEAPPPERSTEEPPPPANAGRAIDALMEAFAGDDPAVRMAAAQSLARATDPRANAFLLRAASNDGSIDHKVSAANALAFDGNSSAKHALKQGLDQGTITPEGIMQVVIGLRHKP